MKQPSPGAFFLQTRARLWRRRRRRAHPPRRRRRRRDRATRSRQPRRRRTFRRRPRAVSRFVNGQTCFDTIFHLSIRSFRRCVFVCSPCRCSWRGPRRQTRRRGSSRCARWLSSSRRVSAWRSRPPRWRRARARLRRTPRPPRHAATTAPSRNRLARRDPRAATVEELRTRVTAAWPRSASSPRVPRFFSASRRADAAPRGGIGGVSPRGKRQSAGSAARWRVAGALAGGAPRSDRESSDVRSNDRCKFVSSTSSRKSHSRRPAQSRSLGERPSKTNFIHLRLSHAKQKRSVRSRRLPRHWSLARATMSACVSFASARALRAPRVSQRRPARKVRVPASRARVARALIPADFPPTLFFAMRRLRRTRLSPNPASA